MPEQASTYAHEIDWVFYFTYWSSAIACVLIIAAMALLVIRYRRRPGHAEQPSPAHSTALEMTWTLVPSVVFVLIFYWGFQGFMNIATQPDNAYEIHVTGVKWAWTFQYPNGAESDKLFMPANRPVRLILQSQDVIHSIFVPAFRMKKDVVPGRYNTIWVEANQTGEFDLYCAEYCGTSHSTMITKAVVLEPPAFQEWVEKAAVWLETVPPVEAGARLWSQKGCKQCHTVDGTAGTGPTFKNLFGTQGHPITGGTSVNVDENYIRNSIVNPGSQVVQGFQNVMPKINISDQEITAVIEYMKSISDKAPKPMEAWPKPETEDGEKPTAGPTTEGNIEERGGAAAPAGANTSPNE